MTKDGIYKVTTGQWDHNNKYNSPQGPAIVDGKQLQACGRIIEPGDSLNSMPPPGTLVYMLGVPIIPDGIYRLADTITSSDD